MSKYIIHLPTLGHPYIIKNKSENLEDLQELVAYPDKKKSYFECVNKNNYIIHPLFCQENKYWNLVNNLKEKCKIKTYCNENGLVEHYNSNMALINIHSKIPLFGEVYMVVSKKNYDKVCKNLGYELKKFNFNEDNDTDDDY